MIIEPAIERRSALRLVGVDTPELDPGEPLAEEAATFTEGELAGEQVTLILAEDSVDPYGRLLGTIKAAGDQSTHGQNLLREG
ncbi:MAG: thermonuclease family protein, partial [Rubrobacter sp.]|nr:thermonuclease family protein [Rubrobacter sp.]